MGLIRRDFGAAGFFSMHLSGAQLLVAMVTITLFVPCMASALVVLKERGWRYLVGLFASSLGFAFLLGGIVHQVLRLLGGMR
jgi:ferrous iron transport protein B